MTLENNKQIHLNPVLALHGYCSTFPEKPGRYTCEISVQSGTVEFQHESYNLQTGIWDAAPDADTPEKIIIHENEVKKFDFICESHDGQTDNISISNNSYLKPALFTCIYKKREIA